MFTFSIDRDILLKRQVIDWLIENVGNLLYDMTKGDAYSNVNCDGKNWRMRIGGVMRTQTIDGISKYPGDRDRYVITINMNMTDEERMQLMLSMPCQIYLDEVYEDFMI